jgi:hypothetical protein
MFALLSPMLWRIIGVAAILGAIGAVILGYGHSRYNLGVRTTTAAYEAALSKQKVEAAQLLASETEKVLVAERQLNEIVRKAKNERDILQVKNAADLKRLSATRLQFSTTEAGCRSGDSGTAGNPSAAASNPGATIVQLPEQINSDLRQLAADAQSILIDYGTLYAYVNRPDLVCELR